MNLRITYLILFFSGVIYAQENQTQKTYTLSLEEAIDFALDSSYTAINARRDIASAIKKKWETTADGLPQINANIDYQNNLKQPVQLLPAEITGGPPGTFIPVVFGTKQQMSATATASQLLFDGSYIVAVRASKTFLEYTDTNAKKTALEIRENVIDAYGNVLLAQESAAILEQNKTTLEDNLEDTKAMFENGLQEEESVEQLKITYLQISNELRNAKRLISITKEMLNLVLGIPLEEQVFLTDDLDSLAEENISLELLNAPADIENNLDYKLARNLTEQREHELNLEKSKALPTLSTFVNYGTSGYSQEFTFLNDNQDWFQSSIWGVSLNIPIFSSFQRNARTAQARIALDKANTQFEQAKEQIRLEIKRAKNNYQFAVEKYRTSKENLDLANRIENKNQIKFTEGIATSFELRQAQTQLYTAQQELLQSMLDLLNAKAALESALNTPNLNFTNN
ncbi:TolC family protein [Mesonia maritima]|uniref:Outer membrane protein TolC n=1 Tax=Mesonia maritima TaxID=1793873 RepID=A0ABU1K397_9FLAO|nr:TolC family protein [Mesonia maritima]MDR6300090.1 outer membrane protein TolC [Mesonia maritima]